VLVGIYRVAIQIVEEVATEAMEEKVAAAEDLESSKSAETQYPRRISDTEAVKMLDSLSCYFKGFEKELLAGKPLVDHIEYMGKLKVEVKKEIEAKKVPSSIFNFFSTES
jgi:hypothetical protein